MTNLPDPGLTPEPSRTATPRWWWRLEDSSGAEVDSDLRPQAGDFPSQADAESWVGETWRELRDGGVHAVTLFEGDREVYGPMGLDA
ncbi:MAG: hypothetical protein Q8Q02_11905 [Nocardioides sp.]|nr:hypothetical protein [Nocardioides sp.]